MDEMFPERSHSIWQFDDVFQPLGTSPQASQDLQDLEQENSQLKKDVDFYKEKLAISENKIVELEQNYSCLHSNYNMALQTAEEHRKELVELRKVLQSC